MTRFFYMLPFLFISSCQQSIDLNVEKEQIQAQIDKVSEAHYKRDAHLFYQPNAEQWYDVRSGQITLKHKKDAIPGTQNYLDHMEFKDMIMRDEPIIEISEDATLASFSNSAVIRGILNKKPIFWVVAWQSTLKKIDGEWKIISTTNTEATNTINAQVILQNAKDFTNASDSIHNLYAMAECKAPDGRDFKTLVLSEPTASKMEQQSGKNHFIIKQGEQSSWSYDVNTLALTDSLSASTKAFVQGHELHWLSMHPESRFSQPTYAGISTFKDQDAFKITFRDLTNAPVNFYYAFENYQPLGFEIFPGQDQDKVVINFDNWDTINKIKVFKKATFTQGQEVFEYAFTDIQFNDLKATDFENKIPEIDIIE